MPAKKTPDQLVRATVASSTPVARSLLRELLATLPKPASKPAGASGSKGQLVQQLLRDHSDWNTKQVAAVAGCSVSRDPLPLPRSDSPRLTPRSPRLRPAFDTPGGINPAMIDSSSLTPIIHGAR